MKRQVLIRLFALLLTATMVVEMTAYVHYVDAVSIEIDSDSEEEENKEDKLKEYAFDSFNNDHNDDSEAKSNSIFVELSWVSPTIDYLTPPPELL